MTIIFSKREDTKFLSNIWKDIPNVNLIEVTSKEIYRLRIQEAIQNEKGLVILCGHGTSNGLLTPDFESMIIHRLNVNILKDKKVICIWCYANEFMEKYDLHGFATSMFISDPYEAYENICYGKNWKTIAAELYDQNRLFAERINKLLINKVDISKWCDELKSQADMSIDFVEFNYNGLITR